MTKKMKPEELKKARREANLRRMSKVDLGEDHVSKAVDAENLKVLAEIRPDLLAVAVAKDVTPKKSTLSRAADSIADVVAERDALAARVMDLEKQASEFQPCTRSHGEGVADLRKFISDCLKTGTFNSTVATELLK